MSHKRSDFVSRLINNEQTDDDIAFIRKATQKRKKPKKSELLKTPDYRPGYLHVIDTLYLPEDVSTGKPGDSGFKYVLTVVDVGSGKIGLQPMKSHSSAATTAAIKKIYARKWLSIPKRLKVDPGTEFQGSFKRYMTSKGVVIKTGITDRHSSQLHAETINAVVSKVIFLYQHAEEQANEWKEHNTTWVHLIPQIENAYNAKMEKRRKKFELPSLPKTNGEHILEIGTEVYKYQEAPRDPVDNAKLGNKFRQTDLRLEKQKRTITNWALLDGQTTVAYQLSGMGRHLFTRYDFVVADNKKK